MANNYNFGTPGDDVERAAHDWLQANCGHEGATVMQSLATLIKELIRRKTIAEQR